MPDISLEEFLEQQKFDTSTDEASDESKATPLDVFINENVPGVNADTSPLPIPKVKERQSPGVGTIPGFEVTGTPEGFPSFVSQGSPGLIQRAADAGILFDNPAPSGHFTAGFAVNRENELEAYRQSLGGAPVRIGPRTKRIEWFDADKGRWSLVNPPGEFSADAQGMAGPALALGVEGIITAAALATGGVAGAGLKGASLFAGVNTGSALLGEGLRLYIGHRLGINQNLDEREVMTHLAIIGGSAAAFGVVGDKGIRAAGDFYRWLGLDTSTAHLVRKYGMDLEQAIYIQERVNEKLVEGEFFLRLGQASNVEDVLAFERLMMRHPRTSGATALQNKQQQAALRSFFDKIQEPYVTRANSRGAGESVQRVARQSVETRQAHQNMLVEVKEAEFDVLIDGLKDGAEESLGTPLRGFVTEETRQLDQWADDVVTEFSAAVGDVRVKPTLTADLANRLDAKRGEALFPFQKEELTSIIGERQARKSGEQTLGMGQDGILQWEDKADEILEGIWNPDSELTVDQVWNALKSLKRLERRAGSPGAEPMDTKVLFEVIDALQTDLRVALRETGDPTLEYAYDKFITKYATETTRLKRGIIGTVMEWNDAEKRFNIEDPNVFDAVFTKNKRQLAPAEQIHTTIKDDPNLMDVTRGAIVTNWKEFVLDADGKFLPNKHKTWMKNYGPQAELFLSPEEFASLSAGRDIAAQIEARKVARDRAFEEINRSVEMDIYSYSNPEFVIRDILVPNNEGFASTVMDIVTKGQFADAEVAAQVRSGVARKVMQKITRTRGTEGYKLDLNNMNKMLHGEGTSIQENLRVVMGNEYVDDLLALNEALMMVSRTGAQITPTGPSTSVKAVADLTRAWVGLFTTEGRILTAANRLRGRAAEDLLIQSISNPGNLRQLMALADKPVTDPAWRKFVISMGAQALLLEETETPTTGPLEVPDE